MLAVPKGPKTPSKTFGEKLNALKPAILLKAHEKSFLVLANRLDVRMLSL
jgi:hypothetical protein